MDRAIQLEIDALARDRESGATALVGRAIALLRRAGSRTALEEIAAELARAQPSMAGFRTIPAMALEAEEPAAALERLAKRLARAPAAVARHAADLILLGRREEDADKEVRIATCSRSLMVETALVALAARTRLVVSCGEGRPALEGRALARALAGRGISVELYSDAGLSSAVGSADALLVGADAICRTHFINKVGTAAVCALAAEAGVPTYLLTGREKILHSDLFQSLAFREGHPGEILEAPPPGLVVRNPYFEIVSTNCLGAVVTEAGVLTAAEVEAAGLI